MSERQPVMTACQIELARHALGLPNKSRRSFRNRFICGQYHRDYADWNAMAESGIANVERRDKRFGGMDFFSLTREGAELARNRDEFLDSEDFPAVALVCEPLPRPEGIS